MDEFDMKEILKDCIEKKILKSALDAMNPELMDQELATTLLKRWKRNRTQELDRNEQPNPTHEYESNEVQSLREYKIAKGVL